MPWRSLYRSLIHVSRRLPQSHERAATAEQVRAGFRYNVRDHPPSTDLEREKLLTFARGRLGFLRMQAPKSRNAPQTSERIVYTPDGKKLDAQGRPRKSGKVISNWTGSNLDPDSVARHNWGLKRMGFRDNAHAKGIF